MLQYDRLDHSINPYDRLHKVLSRNLYTQVKQQYENIDLLYLHYLDIIKNPKLKNNEKLNRLYSESNMTKYTTTKPGSLPVAIKRKGIVAYDLRDPLLRTLETLLYRRRNIDISTIFVSTELEYICSSPNNPPYTSLYPFMNGLCYHKYDKFLNDHDYKRLLKAGKMIYSLDNADDILWDIIYSLKNFNQPMNSLKKQYVKLPGYTNIGCGANTPYFFGLITRERCVELLQDINNNHGLYGTPLNDIAYTLCSNGKVVTIPILGDVNLLSNILNELIRVMPKKNYTFIKFITRLNTIHFGHTVTVIKLYNCAYLIDMTIGNVSKLNQDILSYYCRLHDGVQIITTTIDGSEIFDNIFEQTREIYNGLDLELDEISMKYICKEYIKKINPEIDVDLEYEKLDYVTRKLYVNEYLKEISEIHKTELEQLGMNGGGYKKYYELPYDLYYILYTNINYTQLDILFILYLHSDNVYEYIKELQLVKYTLLNSIPENKLNLEIVDNKIIHEPIKVGGLHSKKYRKFKTKKSIKHRKSKIYAIERNKKKINYKH